MGGPRLVRQEIPYAHGTGQCVSEIATDAGLTTTTVSARTHKLQRIIIMMMSGEKNEHAVRFFSFFFFSNIIVKKHGTYHYNTTMTIISLWTTRTDCSLSFHSYTHAYAAARVDTMNIVHET